MLGLKIYSLGCKVNQYDANDLQSKLAPFFVAVKDDADLAVINTCAVTKTAIAKSRYAIGRAKKENPRAKIVVAGCWPAAYREELQASGAWLAWSGGDLNELAEKISRAFGYEFKQAETCAPVPTDRSRYFIKIQDGCEQFCSYCIIPYTRGKMRSRPAGEILEEIKGAIRRGYKEIVLSGIHLGRYGSKKSEVRSKNESGANLVGLLKKIVQLENFGRVRLSSIEITEVDDELIRLMAKSRKICRHLHIPLQSGSDKILKLMNRPYSADYFRNKIKAIRKSAPDVAITTDIIVGFPGEDGADFEETKYFSREMEFSKIHVFPFSAHEKTKAFRLPGRIDGKVIIARAKELRKLGAELEENYKNKFYHRELEVVILGRNKSSKLMGKTEYYFDIELSARDTGQKPAVGALGKAVFR